MTEGKTDWVKVLAWLPPETVESIDQWRRQQAKGIPSRNEAIRVLLAKGLAAEGLASPETEETKGVGL